MKKSFMLRIVSATLACTFLMVGSLAHAGEGSNRSKHKFGIIVGAEGMGLPLSYTGGLGFNLGSVARLSASYSMLSDSASHTGSQYGGGINFFIPSLNFSPTLGFKYLMGAPSGAVLFDQTAAYSNMIAVGGFDFQAGNGFHFGFGYNYSITSSALSDAYLNLGWFF